MWPYPLLCLHTGFLSVFCPWILFCAPCPATISGYRLLAETHRPRRPASHRSRCARTSVLHQCFAALAVKMQMNTAQSGSTARGLCWPATLVLGAQQFCAAARELCWPATLVLCDSSSRAHGPWLTEAHAHRVCTLDRNGQVETIAHLGSVRPPQRRAPPHETRAPLSAITVLGS